MHAIECHERSYRKLHAVWNIARRSEISLRHLVGIYAAGVLDLCRDIKTAIRSLRHLQPGILERRIAEPVAKREQRIDIFLVEPAIADIHALAVGRLLIDALLTSFRILGICCRIVFQLLAPSHWQASRGADLAEQNVGG